jgi:predicted RNase H-like nuclease (RuvC/YqgF family)
MVIAALMGGGIVTAIVSYIRNRQTGRMEERQFDFATWKESNALLRNDLNGVRQELEEERSRRRSLEAELNQERKLRVALENRVAELEKATGGTHG